jgi:hypothetical protein
MYRIGDGVPQDYKTAVKWYTLAAEQGHSYAQNNLGLIYGNGDGVPQNYKAAVKWYTRAAEQGNSNAQFNLALRYFYGKGIIQDNIYAHMWASISASNGDNKGGVRDDVAKKMTSADISQAQKLALECIIKSYKGC